MTIRFEWLCDLDRLMTVTEDALGAVFKTLIAGHSAEAHFPSDPDMDRNLQRPLGLMLDHYFDWGSALVLPPDTDRTIIVRKFALTAEVNCEESQLQVIGAQFRSAMGSWWTTASTWLELATGQQMTVVGHQPETWSKIPRPIWRVTPDSADVEVVQIPLKPQKFVRREIQPASAALLRRCFDLAASAESPSLPWLLVRDARSLHSAGQFRRAVIDAGSAAEVAVKELIRLSLPPALPPKLVKKLTRGELGTSIHTLRDAGYSVPEDFREV
ncbi:hypothetical protein, partial [Nocardia amikacinitolerans]|uniref:hypothetical protein n=1 Tax=Nocardia amikacinitolerans TaxID=756689 RepID=UPI0012EE248A